jgi:hypothetical protein
VDTFTRICTANCHRCELTGSGANTRRRNLEFYQKALEIDPNFPNAAVARDVVKKLSEELAQKK